MAWSYGKVLAHEKKTGDSPRAGVQVSTAIICISIMKPEGRVKPRARHVEVKMRV